MIRTIAFRLAIALPFVIPLAVADTAVAQKATKKLSYEQAFAQCKKEISANVPMADTTSSADRYAAGGACMKRYGFRLKKKTSF